MPQNMDMPHDVEGALPETSDDMPALDNASVASDEEYQDQDPNNTDSENDTEMPDVEINVRPTRNKGPPARYSDFRAYHAEVTDTPQTLEEVKQRIDYPQWLEAMNTEIQSLNANNTYTEMELPKDVKAIPTRWVYKIKRDEKGRIEKYRARIVVKGYVQRAGIDYTEVYAPVGKYTTARYIMTEVVQNDLELVQLDVAAAYMHSSLEEEVYIKLPGQQRDGRACKLNKALYGLKQSGRAWFQHLKRILINLGLTITHADESLYIFRSDKDGASTFILVYVDDLLLAGQRDIIKWITDELKSKLQIVDKGDAKHFLGMEIIRNRQEGTLWLGQTQNAKDLLEKFGMEHAKGRKTPMDSNLHLAKSEETASPEQITQYQSMIGSLLHLANCTRPDLAQAVGALARHMANPSKEHMDAAKQVLRYLAGSTDLGLMFKRDAPSEVIGYCDADYAGDIDKRKSTSGYVFIVSGGAVSWSSKLQSTVAMSTCESEFMSAAHAAKEALWLRDIKGDLKGRVEPVTIFGDNQGALKLVHHPYSHQRTKHIDVAHRFVQDRVERGELKCDYVPTDKMVADCLTKAVPLQKLQENRKDMGLTNRPT